MCCRLPMPALYRLLRHRLASLRPLIPSCGAAPKWRVRHGEVAMSFGSDHLVLLDRLDEAIRFAPKPTRELLAKIIAGACTRVPVLAQSGKAAEIGRLVESGAWADAALALVELELPGWGLRRLICEEGAWSCSLSRQPNLPAALDETADASHEIMPLAILRAFLQARRMAAAAAPRPAPSVPGIESAPADFVWCENFA
jgi:hypothetical protein